MRIRRHLPGPAMVVAVVALVLALGGAAVAGGVLTTKKFKKKAVQGPITYVTANQLVNNANIVGPGVSAVNMTASCPNGFFPTGGGAKSAAPTGGSSLFVEYSYPSIPNGWTASVFAGIPGPGPAGTPESISVTAVCVKSKSSSGGLQPITS
jgi:hypothetical protein